MTVDTYITININGRIGHGDAAIAIVFQLRGASEKYIRLYGYSGLSYQHAEALAAVRLARLVTKPCELHITTESSYSKMMMEKENVDGFKHEDLWREFHDKMKQMESVEIHRERNHRYKEPSIRRTEKGGYRMEEVRD